MTTGFWLLAVSAVAFVIALVSFGLSAFARWVILRHIAEAEAERARIDEEVRKFEARE